MKVLIAHDGVAARSLARTYTAPQDAQPSVGLLSNGSYTLMVTTSGGGYSTRNGTAVTRWREEAVRDSWGSFCYLRDVLGSLEGK